MNQRKTLIVSFALAAALASPLAFAQSTDAAATAGTSATDTSASAAAQGPAAGGAPASGKKSWADVDTDKDGKLTRTEAGSVPSLAQVFDKADSNTDGALSADEYRAYVAKAQAGADAGATSADASGSMGDAAATDAAAADATKSDKNSKSSKGGK